MIHTLDVRGLQDVSARWLRRFFEATAPDRAPRGEAAYGLLLPHGHPVMTWPIAMPAIAASPAPDVLVVLATSHHDRTPVVLRDDVRTEAGTLPSLAEWCYGSKAFETGRLRFGAQANFTSEHSWRQDLVVWQWLAARHGAAPCVIPILVGDLRLDELDELVEHLENAAFDRWSSVTFVASGDLSHVGRRYAPKTGWQPLASSRHAALRATAAHDRQMVSHLARRDVAAFRTAVQRTTACARAQAAVVAQRAPRDGRLHRLAPIPFFEGEGRAFREQDWFFVAASVVFPRLRRAPVLDGLSYRREEGGVALRQRHSGAQADLDGRMADELVLPSEPQVRQILHRSLAAMGFRPRSLQAAAEQAAIHVGLARTRAIPGYEGLDTPTLRSPYLFPESVDRHAPLRFVAGEHAGAAQAKRLPRRVSSGSVGARPRISFYTDELRSERDEVMHRVKRTGSLTELRITRPSNLLSAAERAQDQWFHETDYGWRASPGDDPAHAPAERWTQLGELVESGKVRSIHGEPAYLAAFGTHLQRRGIRSDSVQSIEVGHGRAWASLRRLLAVVFPAARWRPLYHSSELGPIAATCPFGALHLLEEQRQCTLLPVPGLPGRQGELLVTDLGPLTVRPLVRFPTGDLVRWGAPCRCGARGRPVHLIGRRVHLLPGGHTTEHIDEALLADGQDALFQLEIHPHEAILRTELGIPSPTLARVLGRPVRKGPLRTTIGPHKFSFLSVTTDAALEPSAI